MNQMTPTDFHDRLTAAMPDPAADGPLHAAVADDVTAGRRLLRRRRGTTVLGAAAAVALLVSGGATVAAQLDGGTGSSVRRDAGGAAAAAPAADDHAALLEACRTGSTSDRGNEALFGPGAPQVKAVASTELRTVLAVESADGRFWGRCEVMHVAAEFPAAMDVYDATQQDPFFSHSESIGCVDPVTGDRNSSCDRFSVSMVDRRPDEVATVEIVTADGKTTRLRPVDGSYAFNHIGPLPAGVTPDADGFLPGPFSPIARIRFLDASGTVIAAQAFDGSGTGPDHEVVDGLPLLSAFPSQRGPDYL